MGEDFVPPAARHSVLIGGKVGLFDRLKDPNNHLPSNSSPQTLMSASPQGVNILLHKTSSDQEHAL